MRFLVDECRGPLVAQALRELDHVVSSVYDETQGLDDESIIEKAYRGNYILITNDKDFGELVFRMRKPHKGVILLRLGDERSKNKVVVLKRVLELYSEELSTFLVTQISNCPLPPDLEEWKYSSF